MIASSEHFSQKELACNCCGEAEMDEEFMSKLEEIRVFYGKPMAITSGYRCSKYNRQISQTASKDGPHTTGRAVDIQISGKDAHELLGLVMEDDYFSGIGLSQAGNHDGRFIHVDAMPEANTRPWIWTY
jgi:uncharacterized protein YcbK (DUF882 family)